MWVDIEGYYSFGAFSKQEVGEFEWVGKCETSTQRSFWSIDKCNGYETRSRFSTG